MNNRIARLRQELFQEKPRICSERCRIFTESIRRNAMKPVAIRRAEAYYDVLDQMTIRVKEGELIVGNQARWPKAAPIYPEYSTQWIVDELDGKPFRWEERPGDRFYIDPEDEKVVRESLKYWEDKTLVGYLRAALPQEILDAWEGGIIDETWVVGAGLGNEIPDYRLVLEQGLTAIQERAVSRMAQIDPKEPDGVKKRFFLQGVVTGIDAVVNFSNRVAAECGRRAARVKDPATREELSQLADICRRVPRLPAQTFHEAVQSVYLILLAVHLESNGHAISLGRFDQYLYPFYQRDIEAGRLTPEAALEIIECFFIKANELNKLRSWPDSEFFLGYQMFINLAVGGQTRDGLDAVNPVSHHLVTACRELRLVTPSVSVKWFPGTPDAFLIEALEAAIVHQGGMPAFYNDLAFIRTLRDMGVAEDDLVEWAPDGCIEASIPGKWDFAAKGPWLSVEKVLEITLNNGVDPNSGKRYLPTRKNIEECQSTEEVLAEYKEQLAYFMDLQVVTEHTNDYVHCLYDINPFRSALVADCIERGLDLVEGGAVYSADGGPTAGTISAGDALAAIEYVVFQKGILTLPALLHACRSNFADTTTTPSGPEIQAILKNRAPKFGNDDDQADHWVVQVEEFIGSRYRHHYHSSKYGKGPIPCCFSYSQTPVSGNIAFGRAVGATPDGRGKGDPVNNGVSPANGSERNGATAACNSVGKLPSIYFQKGAIFNMRLTKNSVASLEHRQRVVAMIKALFGKYTQHIQFNVVDNQVYKDARENPANYPDLMVRVSGYSALFTSLAPDCQADVLNRVEVDL
ncbi:MAG: pyruvate formate-lyase [Planctomycetota bacterium]|jgi:formate C-acetyltransferase|nr:pyruvate formate-lyase [Planctomycetota bacterium]